MAPAGQFEAAGKVAVSCVDDRSPEHPLPGSAERQLRLRGSLLNAYFRMGHDPGEFRVWWRALTRLDETLENTYLMRMVGRFSRRVRGYTKAHAVPVIECSVGQRKHDLAEEYLAKTTVTRGLFLILVGRAQGAGVGGKRQASHRTKKADAPGLRRAGPMSITIRSTSSTPTGAI